ncbi:MAG: hypothetical protein FJY17_02590 [Bacteroidetes bacterium]|nr:hypothetical protein [Bacteroidota bacterium]
MKNLNIFLKLIILGLGIYAFQGCTDWTEKGTEKGDGLTDTSRPVDPLIDSPPPITGDPSIDTPITVDLPKKTTESDDPSTEVTTLKGIILYSNKTPARGVKVKVRGKGPMAITNQRGEYKIPGDKTDWLEITPPDRKTQLFRAGIIILLPYESPAPVDLDFEEPEEPEVPVEEKRIPKPGKVDLPEVKKDPPPPRVLKDPVLKIGASDHINLFKDVEDPKSYSYTIEKRSNGQIVKSGQINGPLYFSSLGLQNEVQYVIKIEAPGGKKAAYFSLLNGRLDPKCTANKN